MKLTVHCMFHLWITNLFCTVFYNVASLYVNNLKWFLAALQQLGFDESSLLNEIEQILGVGSLNKTTTTVKPSISPPKGFSLNEYSKPATALQNIKVPEPQEVPVRNASTVAKSNWIRTSSGGYVRASNQENLTENSKQDQSISTKQYSSPQPPERPASPAYELYATEQDKPEETSRTVITSQLAGTSANEAIRSVTKLNPTKICDFKETSKFSYQNSLSQQICNPLRSSSLTRPEVTSKSPVPTTIQRSCEGTFGTGSGYNATPIGFTQGNKGERLSSAC